MIRAAVKPGTCEAAYVPTEAEIARQRAALQETWSKREEKKRGGGSVPFTVPVVSLGDLGLNQNQLEE